MPTLALDDINNLSAPERLAVIGRLWNSLADGDIQLPDAQRVELENCLAHFEQERSRDRNLSPRGIGMSASALA